MTPLYEWAARWNIQPHVLQDLQKRLGLYHETVPTVHVGKSESSVMQAVRIKASQQGRRLWRNNSGAAFRDDGTPVRFGLGNDSVKTHDHLRSSDLIGITPCLIEPRHVGATFGLFTSWEIKKPGWVFSVNDKHSVCQNNWNNLIISLGGDARFITSEEQF
jgi:hypothetical protein